MEDKRTKWQPAVDKCDHRTGISHLWRHAKGLSGKNPHNSANKGVRFADKTYLDPRKIAHEFPHKLKPPQIRLAGDKFQKTAQTAIPSPAINRNAVFHACRHKGSNMIGQIVHRHRTRRDEHPPPQVAHSWWHQLSH